MCDWIALGCTDGDDEEDGESENFPGIKKRTSKVLDIGCGNAAALVYLAKEYQFEHLTGVDYSEAGVALAEKVIQKDEETNHIKIELLDMSDLTGLYQRLQQNQMAFKFDVLFDKGTFDAICLNEDKQLRSKYVASVVAMMTHRSYFVITSCNWTTQELIKMFGTMSTYDQRALEHRGLADIHPPTTRLELFKVLTHPQFSFAGRTGSAVSTVAFTLAM